MNKKTAIPKLRFPEFKKESDWIENSIEEITLNVSAGATPSTSEPNFWGGNIRWMNSGELNLKQVYEVKGRITELGLNNSSTKLLPKECVLIGLAGQGKTRGTVAMNFVELCTNQSIAAIHPNEKVFNSYFLYQNLEGRYDELRQVSAGDGGRGGLNLQIIKNLKIFLPQNINEQRKIACCLSSLEDLIIFQENKIKSLQNYRKGILQQVFPCEGETVPRLRFSDFSNSEEWKQDSLGNLAHIITNKNKDYSIERVLTNSAANGVVDQRDFFNKDIAQKSNLNGYYVVNKGDFVYNPRISNLAPVGPISRNNLGTGVMSPLYSIFRFKKSSTDFFEHFFKSSLWHSYLRSVSNQGARHDRMAINNHVLMEMPIFLPKPEEQQKIASFLSNLDKFISLEEAKKDHLLGHKRGLLQQLFPKSIGSVV